MKILWDKKLIKLSNGSYIAWGIKRKKFFFANKNELKLNCAIIEYYEKRERCDEKSTSDLKKIIAELKEQIEKMKNCSNCNGIIMGGIRTEKCKRCMRDKTFSEWEMAEDE